MDKGGDGSAATKKLDTKKRDDAERRKVRRREERREGGRPAFAERSAHATPFARARPYKTTHLNTEPSLNAPQQFGTNSH